MLNSIGTRALMRIVLLATLAVYCLAAIPGRTQADRVAMEAGGDKLVEATTTASPVTTDDMVTTAEMTKAAKAMEAPTTETVAAAPMVTEAEAMTTAADTPTEAPMTTRTADKDSKTPVSMPAPDTPVFPLDDTTPRKAHWTDHPVYQANPDIVPPIVVWYTTRNSEDRDWSLFCTGRYTQRASRYNLLHEDVRDTLEAKEFWDYDLLQLGTWGATKRTNFLEFETTRESKMCVVMGILDERYDHSREGTMKPPPGFNPVGMVQWDEDSPKPVNDKFADYTGEAISWGFLACKTLAAGTHKMSSIDIIGNEYKLWGYNLIFAEVDGSAPELTAVPPGWTGLKPVQHTMCPNSLHEMWSVEGHDSADADTADKKWLTWHPQKDYLYGCYYGHEHGTPGKLAGYTERFHYTAWKNNRQDESHEGFKTYVIPKDDKFVVVNLHSNTKDMDRINRELHTMVVAVTDKTSGKLLFEMSCKASTGGAAADYATPKLEGTPFYTMGNEANRKLVDDVFAASFFERVNVRKRCNLQNPKNLDPKLRYEKFAIRRGVYEGWHMRALGEFCMNASEPYRNAGPLVDIKNAHTGCIDRECTKKLILGREPDEFRNYFTPNMGTNREIVLRGISIGSQHCDHELPEPQADGYISFYTNPTCSEMCEGPSKNCVLQRIHSSFEGVELNDAYEVSDLHGHNMFEIARLGGVDDFVNRKGGLHGIIQVEGALGVNVEES